MSRAAGWVGDVVAIALPVILWVGVIALIVLHRTVRRGRALVAGIVVMAALLVSEPRLPAPTDPPAGGVTVAAINSRSTNDRPADAADRLRRLDVDVLVVSEVTVPLDELLAPAFADRLLVGVYGLSAGMGVYSRFPLEELGTEPDLRLIRVRVDADAPFVLVAAHLPRPGIGNDTTDQRTDFGTHRRLVRELDRLARRGTDGLPVVLAGDLNLSDRTDGYRVLTESRHDLDRTSWDPAGSTYLGAGLLAPVWRVLLARIDYVLVDEAWCAASGGTFHVPGSDHAGVIGTVGPCAA